MSAYIDPSSIHGKIAPPAETAQVLVVGAGPAGLSAAIEAARLGAQVTLVDENPVDPALMAQDVPLYFGGRISGAARHTGNVIEQMFSADASFEEAVEAGVDVRLGVTAWGLYVNGSALHALPAPQLGLADSTHAWMCGFEKLILATGSRDIAFAMPGWIQPGVMGANGLHSLLERYGAFSGRRLVILGSGALALRTALLAKDKGLDVATVVEVLPRPQALTDLIESVEAWRVPILTEHVPLRLVGGKDGIERIVLLSSDQKTLEIECDTVCVAIGRAPAIELLNGTPAHLVADTHRGGHVPVLDRWATSLPGVFAAGDCAGLARSTADAAEQGRDAARQALGVPTTETNAVTGDVWAYQATWLRAMAAQADDSLMVCQCEEVTRGDLLGVRAPAYLGPPTTASTMRNLASLIADGPVNQDQIKRLTRACMGVCQARRCREQVALMLAQAAGVSPAEIPLAAYRPPVRPLPLGILAAPAESSALRKNWRPWFDIPGQFATYEDIGTEREFRNLYGADL